ncbi:SAM-dependent methyltransferase [Streptomyces sp. SID3343]|uniref:SAM-dependent methyltransferase n=1 Tax=Streptomyces sp. SID3343 TaxID=2690260 RepID=UPI0031F989A7
MGGEEEPVSHSVDVNVPSVARMYDWLLGGTDNYAADEDACLQLLRIVPTTRALALNNRLFLQRVVHTLATEYGIRQFLDHGSGLPTQDNVHQVAQRVDSDARVVYIDNDPLVLAHGRTLLDQNDRTTVIQAEMTDTDGIFEHPDVRRLIEFKAPVAALFVSVLHCIPDEDDPAGMIERVASRLVPGSIMVVCQLVSEHRHIRDSVTEFMAQSTNGSWGRVREPREVDAYFIGKEILEPGLVEVSRWRPDTEVRPRQGRDPEWIEYGGVARLR